MYSAVLITNIVTLQIAMLGVFFNIYIFLPQKGKEFTILRLEKQRANFTYQRRSDQRACH